MKDPDPKLGIGEPLLWRVAEQRPGLPEIKALLPVVCYFNL